MSGAGEFLANSGGPLIVAMAKDLQLPLLFLLILRTGC